MSCECVVSALSRAALVVLLTGQLAALTGCSSKTEADPKRAAAVKQFVDDQQGKPRPGVTKQTQVKKKKGPESRSIKVRALESQSP